MLPRGLASFCPRFKVDLMAYDIAMMIVLDRTNAVIGIDLQDQGTPALEPASVVAFFSFSAAAL